MLKHLWKCLAILVLTLTLLTAATETENAWATEGGGGAYPNGAEDFMVGALPPPGTYLLNYMLYYTADKFKSDAFRSFDLDVFANTFRLIHVTKHQVLGASWGVQAFVPIVYQDVSVGISGGPDLGDNRWGIGDIIIDPILLGWHSKNFHAVAGLDIYLPVGTYDQDRLVNAGRNYWTFEPAVAFTYLSDGGFEVSAKFMYDFNTKNTDTEYLSGQEFHFDYTVGYHIKGWSLGVGGYYYYQTTNDELDGQKVGSDGFKGREWAIGPQVKYDYKNMMFTLKWQAELDAKNKPEGDRFWFKFLYAF